MTPAWLKTNFVELENWNLGICDKAEALLRQNERDQVLDMEDTPAVYSKMQQAIEKIEPKLTPID